MRCARCGNENPGNNRFCGMCGATLIPAAATTSQKVAPIAPQPTAPAPRPAAPPAPEPSLAPRPAAPAPAPPRAVASSSADSPPISGPSFLGLNQPAPSAQPRRAGNLSIDPNSASHPRDLDYLLEDEHEHRSGGSLKYVLILVALALAVGLGYLRFKNQGLAWLKGNTNKPPATQDADSNPATPAGSPENAPSQPVTPPPAAGNAPLSSPDSSAGTPAVTPPETIPPAKTPANASPSAADSAGTSSGRPGEPATPAPKSTKSAALKKPSSNDADDVDTDADSNSDSAPETAKPAKEPKPSASIPSGRSDAAVIQARNYIYGRGVRQDCERGMHLLKPAAAQANPKAMIEMGALYSAGLCTPRDLPTAYRWFAMALRKEPDNQSVQTDLQKLWGEMTQPERQLAIKLSQ